MAKVPEGQTAATWDGSGKVWFKTYAEQATIANGQLSWGSLSMYQTIIDAYGVLTTQRQGIYHCQHSQELAIR
jgi:hypothetical protein